MNEESKGEEANSVIKNEPIDLASMDEMKKNDELNAEAEANEIDSDFSSSDIDDDDEETNAEDDDDEEENDDQDEDGQDNESYRNKDDFKFDEFDLKRLRHIGLFKAYLEFYNSLPELFKYSTQFQVIPLSVCCDLQQQSTSMYVQSIIQQQHQNYQQTTSSSNYSNYFSSGFGTGWSDLDIDFKLSLLKTQAFNTFSISKRFFMSPSHNYYLNMNQQQNNPLRPKSLTGFGPAAYEEKYLKENLLASFIQADSKCLPAANSFNQLRKPQFYSPLFILAPSTITSTAIALAASNLFFKNADAGLGNWY